MNYSRVALTARGATVPYFAAGFLFFGLLPHTRWCTVEALALPRVRASVHSSEFSQCAHLGCNKYVNLIGLIYKHTEKEQYPGGQVRAVRKTGGDQSEDRAQGRRQPLHDAEWNMFTYLNRSGSLALRLPQDEREKFLKNYKRTLFEA